MYDSLRAKLNVVIILIGASLMWWVIANRPDGPQKAPHPGNAEACANMSIVGVKEGLVKEAEDDWSVVYVTDRWDRVLTHEKEEIGYFFALCKSENDVTEIRRASDGSTIRKFVIDLDYRMRNGLPVDHLVPGQ